MLKEACKRLYNGGYVNKDFFDDVMKREKIEPTAIGNGVAIPHGTPDNVIKPKVFVVRLAHPINWGGKMVDTIFVLAINFDNIGSTKAFFHDFARLLGSGDKIARIRKSSDIREMEKILKEELSWE
ncbi:MAG: PTS sugar transporter subunit IIA [Eubacterium ventriosum]